MIKEIIFLLKKDLQLEFRSQERLAGVLLYLFTSMLVLYYSLTRIEKFLWVGVFWILFTFLSITALQASFSKELKNRHLYYYSLVHPLSLFIAKVLFNFISLLGLSFLSLFLMNVFFNMPDLSWNWMIITLIICSLGISIVFTFVSIISGKTSEHSTLMAILATPLIFPILMSGTRLMLNAFGILNDTSIRNDILNIVGINLLSIGLAVILFPILWRD